METTQRKPQLPKTMKHNVGITLSPPKRKKVVARSMSEMTVSPSRQMKKEKEAFLMGFGAAAPPAQRKQPPSNAGFGALPPKLLKNRQPTTKQNHQCPPSSQQQKRNELKKQPEPPSVSGQKESAKQAAAQQETQSLLQDAEHLIQQLLGDESVRLTEESINKVLSLQKDKLFQQTKQRYSSLLEKPWRATPDESKREVEPYSSESAFERMSSFEEKNPKTFKRSSSMGGLSSKLDAGDGPDQQKNTDRSLHKDLEQSKKDLATANYKIAQLRQEVSVLMQATEAQNSSNNTSSQQLSINDNLGLDVLGCDDETTTRETDASTPATSTAREQQQLQERVIELQNKLAQAETGKSKAQAEARELQKKLSGVEQGMSDDGLEREQQENEYMEKIASCEQQLAESDAILAEFQEHANLTINELQAKIATLEEELVYAEAQLMEEQESRELQRQANNHEESGTGLRLNGPEMLLTGSTACETGSQTGMMQSDDSSSVLMRKERTDEMEQSNHRSSHPLVAPEDVNTGGGDDDDEDDDDDDPQGSENTPPEVTVNAYEHQYAQVEAELSMTRENAGMQIAELQDKISDLEEELVYAEAKLMEEQEKNSNGGESAQDGTHSLVVQDLEDQLDHAQTELSQVQEEAKAMKERIAKLEHELAEAEAKVEELTSSKAIESDQKLIDAENMLKRKEKELEEARIDVSVAKVTAESTERKLQHLEEMHNSVVQEMQDQLSKSEEKNKMLNQELSDMMPVNTELSQAKMDLQQTTYKLEKTEETIQQMKTNQETTTRRFEEERNELEGHIQILKQSVMVANANARSITRQMEDLQEGQSKEREILSEELRESETTIADLMEELNNLRPLTAELERLEEELEEAKEKLHIQQQNVNEHEIKKIMSSLKMSEEANKELRDQLDLIKPLASDLEEAEQELEETRAKLKISEQELGMVQKKLEKAEQERDEGAATQNMEPGEVNPASLRKAQVEVAELRQQLDQARKDYTSAQIEMEDLKNDLNADIEILREQLEESRAVSSWMQEEADKNNEIGSSSEAEQLQQALVRKDKEIESLQKEIEEKEEKITTNRIHMEEMYEERNYARAKMAELKGLVDGKEDPQGLLKQKSEQCAKLHAERDSLQKRLTAAETVASTIEQDNKQKKELIQQLISEGETNTESVLENLQEEQERTLERCAHLSLQLAESQFKVDELTETLRKMKKKTPQNKRFERSHSFSPSPSPMRRPSLRPLNMLGKGIDRLTMALDDSVREYTLDDSQRKHVGSTRNESPPSLPPRGT